MGVKRYQIKFKGVNKPAWTAQDESNQRHTSWQVHTGPKLVSMHRPPFLHGCWSHCWWLSQRVPGRHEQCNIHQSQTTSLLLWHQSPQQPDEHTPDDRCMHNNWELWESSAFSISKRFAQKRLLLLKIKMGVLLVKIKGVLAGKKHTQEGVTGKNW